MSVLDRLDVDRRGGRAQPAAAAAVFSPCGAYRYALTRRWDDRPALAWVMCNPSTGDADRTDATLRRVRRFSADAGAGGMLVVNAFAYRSTDPRGLRAAADPVGADNDAVLAELLAPRLSGAAAALLGPRAGRVVVAWGAHGTWRDRDREVLALLAALGADPACLGVTTSGAPRHPLRVAACQPLVEWCAG